MNFDDVESLRVNMPVEGKEAVRLFHEAAEHAKAGRFDNAVSSATAIETTKFRYWFEFQSEALVNACAECADTGQIERALQISKTVAPKYKSAALHWIALACLKYGRVEKAIEVARVITDDYVRDLTLRALEVDLE